MSDSGDAAARGPEEGDAAAGTSSVDRAVTVLEIIARLGDASVSDVAAEVGVHRSTVSRLLVVLERRGLVEQAGGGRGRYRLGMGVLRLAGAVRATLDVTVEGRGVCTALAAELGETVNIAVLQHGSAVNVVQSGGGGAIVATSWVGRPTPLHATSSGKVLLAYAAERLLAGHPLESFTANTLTDPADLAARLATVRAEGYATTVEEFEVGLSAMAAPVRGADGAVIAALSVSGPSYRLTPSVMESRRPSVVAAALAVSRRMGYLA